MKYFFLISVIIAMLVVVILMPFAVVWALNTLFTLNIGYTFTTWLATVILLGVLVMSSKVTEIK